MKAKDINVGKRVKYYPIMGDSKYYEEAYIISETMEICGSQCCRIDIRPGVVDINSLEEWACE